MRVVVVVVMIVRNEDVQLAFQLKVRSWAVFLGILFHLLTLVFV